MPELLGFEEKNGKILAIVNFSDARKFTLIPNGAEPVVTKQPRTARYDFEGAGAMVVRCLEKNNDPGFWTNAVKLTEERQQRFDDIKKHGACDVLEKFMQAAYQSGSAGQIIVPELKPARDFGMKH